MRDAGERLEPCPFCGGEARMDCGVVGRGNGGFTRLMIFVDHDPGCIIHEKDEIACGFIAFDYKSEVGKSALRSLERAFASKWNRRAGS